MIQHDDEERLLRAVAIQNASAILIARQRAEQELLQAKEALELKSRELAHSLAMMRATLEATTDGVLVTDELGNVTDFNERYLTMWRLPREVVASGRHQDILETLARQLAAARPFLDRLREIDASSPEETFDVLELADGRVFERFSRLKVVDARNVGRVWSIRDVTQARRAEEALRDETRVLELLNRTGTRLSSKLDLQELVQAVTDAATELSGAKFGAFFYNVTEDGDGYRLYTLSGARREDFEQFGQPRATPLFGPTFRGEGVVRSADVLADPRYGRVLPHRGMPAGHLPVRSYLAVPVVSRSGEVIGGLFFGHPDIGVFTDRAERIVVGMAAQAAIAMDNARLYQIEQRARALAEAANRSKDEFLATLSHELRTPLNSILGWSVMLRSGQTDAESLRRGMEVIERNARAQSQLIEDLLDVSRIITGKLRLDVRPVDLVGVINAVLESVRPSAEAKGIRLQSILDAKAGSIAGDPDRLQQVMWNLLSNAIKFTPGNGQVQIRLGPLDSHVEIVVSDTGSGISGDMLPYVFDRFRQADSTSTRRHSGLGLGLSLVKHLVELHGGSVRVESPGPGQGATFVVTLPLVARVATDEGREPTARHLESSTMVGRLEGARLLVVDDDPETVELFANIFAQQGAEVVVATNAVQAVAQLSTVRPDVLICDIEMPGEDGYSLIRKVRSLASHQGGSIPAIAVTAYGGVDDRIRLLAAGFQMHVPKPVEPAELVAAVASVAGRTGR